MEGNGLGSWQILDEVRLIHSFIHFKILIPRLDDITTIILILILNCGIKHYI